MQQPNYSEWKQRQLWTLVEAACLLSGIKPVPPKQFDGNPETGGRAAEIYADLKDAIDLEQITFLESRDPYIRGRRVKPHEVVTWAAARGFDVPLGLSDLKRDEAERAEPSPDSATSRSAPRQAVWKETAREYATEIWHRNRKAGATPSKTDLAKEIAARFRTEQIEGSRGPLDEETIRRHALNSWSPPSVA